MEETNEYRAESGEIKPELSMKGFLSEQAVTVPRAMLEMFPCCASAFSAHQLMPLVPRDPQGLLAGSTAPLGRGQISQAFSLRSRVSIRLDSLLPYNINWK